MSSNEEVNPIGLTELIYKVKQDLYSKERYSDDPVPLFAVEEVQLELAVSVTRELDGGINIQVLSLGRVTANEKAQTVRVTLKPLLSKEEIVADLRQKRPELFEQIREESQKTMVKEA